MKFNCLKATAPLRRSSLLFTTKFPDIVGAHLIDGRMSHPVVFNMIPLDRNPATWESSAIYI